MSTKTRWTCSMTRANKLLAHLREGSKSSVVIRRGFSIKEEQPCHKEVNMLHFESFEVLDKQLDDIRSSFVNKLERNRLIEKLRNRIFELNIQYGINKILSEISLLKSEKAAIAEIVKSVGSLNCISTDALKKCIEDVRATSPDKMFSCVWRINAFDIEVLKNRLEDISSELSELDEKKDKLNIENTFSIELTENEKSILNI